MSTDREEEEEEELPTPRAEGAINTDAAFIDLRDDRERQAYALIKDRVFANTKESDSALLEKTGMDSEFDSIWHALGWENFVSVWEISSRPLTIQFLCTLREDVTGIMFRFHGMSYRVSWPNLSCTLGFHRRCVVSLDLACKDFIRDSF